MKAAVAMSPGPYKDLDYYYERDEQRFGGRESDIADLTARIATNRTLVFYGRSGLGKTSVILAGVFPELRRRALLPMHIRTLEHPLEDLCRGIAFDLKVRDHDASHEGLLRLLRSAQKRVVPVIVLDQFEEFFIRFGKKPKAREAFVKAITAAVADSSLDFRLVFSLREDYLAALDDFQRKIPGLFDKAYRLLPLTAFGARQAIVQPLIADRIAYDETLVSRLVNDLAGYDFDSARLQIACTEIYRSAVSRVRDKTRLTSGDLDNIGGLDDIFARYLGRAVTSIPQEHHLLGRTILDALMTSERTKRALTLRQLRDTCCEPGWRPARELVQVLRILVKHRLVRSERRDRRHWYELSHECLVPEIERWLRLDRQFFDFLTARELIVNSARGVFWRDNPELFLTSTHLDVVISPFKERLRLAMPQLQFVVRSAIFRGSSDAAFWMKRNDQVLADGRSPSDSWVHKGISSREVVLNMSNDPNASVRKMAATAAALLPEIDSSVSERLRDMGLSDPSLDAKRAAGRALAQLDIGSHIGNLRKLLADRATRKQAYELMADMIEDGKSIKELPLWQRLMARRVYDRRMFKRYRDAISARASVGRKIGALAGAAWGVGIGLPWVLIYVWTASRSNEKDWLVNFAVGATMLMITATILGSLAGWRSARLTSRSAALRGERSPFLRLLRWMPPTIVLSLSFYIVVVTQESSVPANIWGAIFRFGEAVLISGAILFLLALFVDLSLRRIRFPVRLHVLLREMAAANAVLVVCPVVLSAHFSALHWNEGWLFWIIVLCSAFFSLFVASSAAAIAHGEQQHPISVRNESRYRPPTRLTWTRIAAVVPVAGIIWFVVTFGLNSVPPLVAVRQAAWRLQPASMNFPLERAWGLPDTDYVKVESEDPPAFFKVRASTNGSTFQANGSYVSSDGLVALNPGPLMLSLSHSVDSTVGFEPVKIAGSEGMVPKQVQFVRVDLTRDPLRKDVWTGRIAGQANSSFYGAGFILTFSKASLFGAGISELTYNLRLEHENGAGVVRAGDQPAQIQRATNAEVLDFSNTFVIDPPKGELTWQLKLTVLPVGTDVPKGKELEQKVEKIAALSRALPRPPAAEQNETDQAFIIVRVSQY